MIQWWKIFLVLSKPAILFAHSTKENRTIELETSEDLVIKPNHDKEIPSYFVVYMFIVKITRELNTETSNSQQFVKLFELCCYITKNESEL